MSEKDYEVISFEYLPSDSGFSIFHEFSILKLSVKIKESGKIVESSFLLKTPPKTKSCAEFVSKIKAFHKESSVYKQILNGFNNQTNKFGPDCFLASEKVIALDNAFDLGFKKLDINKELNLHQCELVLEALAKLHAGSLIMEESKKTNIPNMFPDVLFETLYSDETNHPGFDFMCTGINTLEAIMTTHFSNFPLKVIKDTMSTLRNLPFKLKPSRDFKNVLNHGGIWAATTLFSFGTDGSATDVRLIDFSSARYAPPACDVLIFLHLTTSRAFRELHQGALLTHYYSKLAKEVQSKGLDLGEILPWVDFEASVQHYVSAAIVFALLHLHVALLPGETLSSLKNPQAFSQFMSECRSEQVLSAYSSDESYRRRLSQAIVQALEYTQFRGRRRSSVYISK